MVDVRIKERFSLEAVTMDWVIRSNQMLDEREELATAVRVALGTDRVSRSDEVLPDLDSTDRRGWWGDWQADEIWGGWTIGTKAWLLLRSKIMDAPSSEGSTVERARLYTMEALQPFVERRIASGFDVQAARTGIDRITVVAKIFRGPLPEIDLRYQILWENIREPAEDFLAYLPTTFVQLEIDIGVSCNATVRTRVQAAASLPIRMNVLFDATWHIKRPAGSALLRPQISLAADSMLQQPVILLHMQGNNNTTDIIDSQSRHVCYPFGAYINTLQYKFFDSSCYFDGTSWLRCDGHEDFHFGTRNFTIHFWFRWWDRTGFQHIWRHNENDDFRIYKHSDHTIRFWCFGADRIIGTTACLNDTWYHISLCRFGSFIRLWLLGNQEGATYNCGSDDYPYPGPYYYPYWGSDGISFHCRGWFQELIVLRDFGIHTVPFTPPNRPYGF